MAEAIVSLVVDRLGALLLEEIAFLRGVRGQLQHLQKQLETIKEFMKTVDSYHNQDQDIRDWVADVRDLAYDVDDIIDAFLLKVASKEGDGSGNVFKQYIHMPKKLFNFTNIEKEIDLIFAKAGDISKKRKRFGITSVVQREGTISSPSSEMLLRRAYVPITYDEPIGLEDQTNNMVAELRKEEDRLCIMSIHGMGGLGKSTLANKIYNHPHIKNHFECYAWAFISQKLNTKYVLQEIVRQVSSITREGLYRMNEAELFEKLHEILKTNRYLVVLDDIWSKEAWDALKPAFPDNKGSKVMFTTRNLEVAKHADQRSFHLPLQPLTDNEAWELLCKKAFTSNVSDSSLSSSSDFEECGRNMVKKCGGFPLQVIVLGRILAFKRTRYEWEVVSKQIETLAGYSQDNIVFSTLSLSYTDLPCNMKPLFLYLGLFPEDFLIPVKKLVHMWMAESLIMQENEEETIEEVGIRYLNELIHRSMVQIGEKSMGGKKLKTCRLHDKMRDLCITIGREENFLEEIKGNGGSSYSSYLARTSNKLRRCAIYIEESYEQNVFLKQRTQSLHAAILIQSDLSFDWPITNFKNFKILKVLDFEGSLSARNWLGKLRGYDELARLLGKLTNLRYLRISTPGNYQFREIMVKSFKNLVCLQTLDLRGISMVGKKIFNTMHQLRHLYGWKIKLSTINKMTNLQTLLTVRAGPWMTDLVKLTNLEKLGIFGLDEETSSLLTMAIGGGGLGKLRSLFLQVEVDNDDKGFGFPLDLLDALSGKLRLQKLRLHGRISKLPFQFPSNLIKLTLWDTHSSEDLMPTLENLQHLLFLELSFDAYVGKQMVCSAKGFAKLEILLLRDLYQLEEWTVEKGAMPSLTTCSIHYCEKLKMVPQGFKFLTMLQELKIIGMPNSFEERVEQGGEDWETVQHIPSITIRLNPIVRKQYSTHLMPPDLINRRTEEHTLEVIAESGDSPFPVVGGSTPMNVDPPAPVHSDNASGDAADEKGESEIIQYNSVDELFEIMKGIDSSKTFIWSCLSFWHLFPKNYEFYRDDIIHLWIAQGFIPLVEGITMEESAHSLWDKFEQMRVVEPSCLDCSTGRLRYKLNHSFVDLLQGQPCVNNSYFRLDDGNTYISESTLHVSLQDCFDLVTPIDLYLAKGLFTLLILHKQGSHLDRIPRDLFLKLPLLKALDLSHTSIIELPSSIGNLEDLRYLNLSGTPITTLPDSLCSLSQMQTLKLKGCLKLLRLPKGLSKLINLRHLDVDVSCLLVSMPPRFGNLVELQTLPAFVVGKESGCQVTELKKMMNLRGTFSLLRLENVSSLKEAEEAALDQKKNLNKLEFHWTELQDGLEILENLQPHTEVLDLQIVGYGGTKFPGWIKNPVFSVLRSITIQDCRNCEILPSLGRLPSLKSLSISDMIGVETIGSQFYGRDNVTRVQDFVAFPTLEFLILRSMPSLEEWSGLNKVDFPMLQKLNVSGCPKLAVLPKLSHLNCLKNLEISLCPTLKSLPDEGLPNSMQFLVIIDCPVLKDWCHEDGVHYWGNTPNINVWIDCQKISQPQPLENVMLPSEVIPKASPTIHESLAISNPTLVAMPDVFINAFEEEEKNFDDEQATSNLSKQLQLVQIKTSSEIEKLPSEMETIRPQSFSLSDLKNCTSNFSEEIGSSGYGVLYKGQFLDGMEVAVKVLNDMEVFDETFMDVVMTLEMVNHPYIVKLHGYCFDGRMKALVYEFFGNGSLDIILYRNHGLDIEWKQLCEIAIETAKGLSVLHAAGIIHHDIKASKILLSSNLSPKIRSFGLEWLIIMKRNDDVTRIAGSYGYSAPETWIPTSEVTSKSDVYSFGMLLFEVLGRRCITNHRGKEWFPAQVWMMLDKGLLGKVREDCGINKKDRKKAYNLSKVALWCAQFDPLKRPSMSSVAKMLEMEIPVMDPPNPFPYAQLSSTSSSPEVNPSFNSKAFPSIKLSFLEKKSLEEKSRSGGDWDELTELHSRLDLFQEKCPPEGENFVVLYTAVGWQDRITECNYVRSILKSHQVEIIERDISANSAYWVELRKLLDRTEVPALFVHGKLIGGVNEVKSLEEEGKLKFLLYSIPVQSQWVRLLGRDLRRGKISRKELDFKKISRRRSI